ncbi:hypothetical protein [Brachybacterium atlanticum]|uniref:hypothetical protein n=1 Tax=Brachybacterium atlanticum TaxID=2911888 RepID=UPI0021E0F066|nr:hypothetical protein [Brachybacterium atlanticum]
MSSSYASAISAATSSMWGEVVSASVRSSALEFMKMDSSVLNSAAKAIAQHSAPMWMDSVRQVASAPLSKMQPAITAASLSQSFHRDLLAAMRPRNYDVLSSIKTPAMSSLIASAGLQPGLLNPSTTVISSLVKEMDLGWKPLHLVIPGLAGGPVPGFDATVRSILGDVAERLGTELEVPGDEIEFTAWPDVELQPDPEYIDYTNGHGQELQSAFWPRRKLMQAARNAVFIILVYSLATDAAPGIIESLPTQVSAHIPEDPVPDEIQPPDWLWKAILLGYGIRTARKDTADPDH